MGHLTLILGGARSGKSALAERWACELGGESVLFVATAEPHDEEMRRRIIAHRASRPSAWRTLEAPRAVDTVLRAAYRQEQVIIVDCLTLLVSNILLSLDEATAETEAAQHVQQEVERLLLTLRELPARSLLISNEVGMGLVPPYPLGRLYRDVLGRVNQQVAAAADEVFLVVAGLPLPLKEAQAARGVS